MSEFINGDLLLALEGYYEKVDGYDSLDWRNLLCVGKLTSVKVRSVLANCLYGIFLQLVFPKDPR